jgi:flagellar protein FliO/FliZ
MKFLIVFLFLTNLLIAAENSNNEAAVQAEALTSATVVGTDTKASKESESLVIKETATSGEKLAGKKENEIPLNLESKKATAGNESPFFKFIFFVGILGTLLAGAWILIKKYNTKNISRNHNQIKILAQHYLGPKKSLAVVRVAGESILVGITDNNINMIKSLALLDEEIPDVTPNDFNKLIEKDEEVAVSHVKDQVQMTSKTSSTKSANNTYSRAAVKSSTKNQVNESIDAEDDEFSIKGIKDIVSSKLKNMRSI